MHEKKQKEIHVEGKRDYRAIVTCVGLDKPGIVARVSQVLADQKVNINDISQSFVQDFFTMILIVDFKNSKSGIIELKKELSKVGEELGMNIQVLHEDVFKAMHRI